MVAFDLLYLNGYDLRKLPVVERKAHLKKLISPTDIQYSESFEGDGPEFTSMRVRSDSKASSARSRTAGTVLAGETTG